MSWFWYLIIPLVVGGGHFLIVHELGKESKLRIWHGSAVLIWYFLIAFSNLRNEYPIFSFNPVDPSDNVADEWNNSHSLHGFLDHS
jgi:hypothetical protein